MLETLQNANFEQGLTVIPAGAQNPVFAVDKYGNATFNGDVKIVGDITADDITIDDVTMDTISVGNGTAALPSVTFASDPDTGIYRNAANTVGITAAGVVQATVATTGFGVVPVLNLTAGMNLGAAQAIDATTSININEAGADVDVRIESDTNANHFISDAGAFTGAGAISFGATITGVGFVAVDNPALTSMGSGTNFAKLLVNNNSAVTLGTGTTPIAASLFLLEPNLTVGGTVDDAYTAYIASAPTEGTRNGALWIAAGTSRFDALIQATSFSPALVTVLFAASPYTVLATDFTILGNAVGGAIVVTLPAASAGKRMLNIKKIDATANAVTPTRAGSDTIDGATTYPLSTQYQSVTLQSDGVSAWRVL